MKTNNITDRTLWRKILILTLIAFALMIPIFMVESLAEERKTYRNEVVAGLNKSWGNSSWFGGLYLQKLKSKKYITLKGSRVTAQMKSSIKKRGLYKIPVYTNTIIATGKTRNTAGKVRIVVFNENAFELSPLKVKAGSKTITLYAKTTNHLQSAPITLPPGSLLTAKFTSYGIANWRMAAQAASTTTMTTDWLDLSFFGTMLPSKSEFNADATTPTTVADWSRHRKIPVVVNEPVKSQSWTGRRGESLSHGADELGVALFGTESIYTQTDRLLKYSFLFLFLTVGLFFIHEIYYKIRIHPIEYGLVGLALALFYLIVLSVSEHISFGWAYLFGAVIVLSMLHFYTGAILKRKATALSFVIATLYTVLYVLLCLETFSLLVGTFFLVILLTLVMYFTRHIDWYNLETIKTSEA